MPKATEPKAQALCGFVAEEGPKFSFRETEIVIDGISYRPITILEAARYWKRYAGQMDWPLRDFQGRKICGSE